MEEETDPFVDCEFREVANTKCEHYFVEDPQQDPNSDMTSVVCTKCPSGANITKSQKLKDGKIINV